MSVSVRPLAVRMLVAGILLAAAAPLRAQADVEPDLSTVRFARALGVDLARSVQRPSGLYVRDLRAGRGDSLAVGRAATLRLRMRLPDGTAVGEPESITLTWRPGVLVPGVEQGVRGMRVGARRQLVIPAALAFAERGATGVPPHSPLVVDVEVLAAR